MSRSVFINVEGKEIELYLSVNAFIEITERCGGDITFLSDWFKNGSVFERIEKITGIVAVLANGAVVRHNYYISSGFKSDEKKLLYSSGYFADKLYNNFELISVYCNSISSAIDTGASVDVPKGIEIEEQDADLAEIEAEKRKKTGAQNKSMLTQLVSRGLIAGLSYVESLIFSPGEITTLYLIRRVTVNG